MKTLNDKEMAVIDKDSLKVELATEKLRVSILKVKNLELQQRLIALEIISEKSTLETLRTEESRAKMVRADNLKIIAKKKGLKEGWGFNPDSGEIIEN